jgi:hypothetical protein
LEARDLWLDDWLVLVTTAPLELLLPLYSAILLRIAARLQQQQPQQQQKSKVRNTETPAPAPSPLEEIVDEDPGKPEDAEVGVGSPARTLFMQIVPENPQLSASRLEEHVEDELQLVLLEVEDEESGMQVAIAPRPAEVYRLLL